MEGEKLSGHQIARAVESAYRRLGLPHDLVSALPMRGDGEPSYYGILTDSQSLRDDVMARRFVAALDEALMSMNLMYSAKRRDHSIAPPRLMRLSRGSWSRHIEIAGRQRGTGDTQHKHPLIFREGTWPEGTELLDVVRIDEPQSSSRHSAARAPRAQSR
jgi:hypothetical protein